jgi:hypothetical protein
LAKSVWGKGKHDPKLCCKTNTLVGIGFLINAPKFTNIQITIIK